jgi:hypothetical protein
MSLFDPSYQEEDAPLPRAALNGSPLRLANFWTNSGVFLLTGEQSPLLDVVPKLDTDAVLHRVLKPGYDLPQVNFPSNESLSRKSSGISAGACGREVSRPHRR